MTFRRRRAQTLELPGIERGPIRTRWSGSVRSERTRKGPSPAPQPWQAVVLGVDTARRSGWSIWLRGRLVAHGELDTLRERELRAVVAEALRAASVARVPCVLVLEKPWGGNVDVVAALGAARERWLAAWRELAEGHRGKVVLVAPATWRAPLLGRRFNGAPREQCRSAEQAYARALVARDESWTQEQQREIGGDEAAGVCIGYWGTQAGEVGRLLGKRVRRASLAAWTGEAT